MKTQTDRIRAALAAGGYRPDAELWNAPVRVQAFRIADGRDGQPCELSIVPYRRWRHWRQVKAGRKGGAVAGAQWRSDDTKGDAA